MTHLQVCLIGFGSIGIGLGGIAYNETVWAAQGIWVISATCLIICFISWSLGHRHEETKGTQLEDEESEDMQLDLFRNNATK